MAASNWGTDRRLDEILFASGCEFEFFQAVRLLTHLRSQRSPAVSGSPAEIVRFRAHNSLAFPASSIASIDRDNGGLPSMTVTFLGLTGPKGALPTAYTEMAVDRKCFGDLSFADFLDLFNHRLVQLFYQSWEKHHFFVGYEQAEGGGLKRDAVTGYLFDLIGMGTAGLQGRLPIPDQALLRYAGLLSQRPHSAEALRALLSDYFELPVKVEQLLGKWHALQTDEMCCLGSDRLNGRLGQGAVAGDAVWTRQALVRLVFGPLTAEQFRSFLPDGKRFQAAAGLTRWFLGGALEFEVQPTIQGDQVPGCALGDDSGARSRLGWSSWLRTEPFPAPARDAVFSEEEFIGLEA